MSHSTNPMDEIAGSAPSELTRLMAQRDHVDQAIDSLRTRHPSSADVATELGELLDEKPAWTMPSPTCVAFSAGPGTARQHPW